MQPTDPGDRPPIPHPTASGVPTPETGGYVPIQPGGPLPPPSPQQPPTVAPPAVAAPPASTPSEPKKRRTRLILAMVGGILAILCLGGVGVFISFYDEATKIERTNPDAVVDNFLRAYLVNRDDKEASLYTCGSGLDLSKIAAFRDDISARESRFSISIQVVWEGLVVATQGSTGTVDVDLTRTLADDSEQVTRPWRFNVVDENGWRVCGGAEQPK